MEITGCHAESRYFLELYNSMLNKNCTTQQTRLKQTSKSVLFSISHVLVSKDHPLNKDQMMLCTTRKRQEEETEICWFGCITAYILGLRDQKSVFACI